MIKKFYIINLDKRKDRWENLNTIINSCSFNKENILRFSAIDGYNFSTEINRLGLENNKFIQLFTKYKKIVRKNEFACFLSHSLVLEKISNDDDLNDDDYVGIFEDDWNLCVDFEKNYEIFKQINLSEYDMDILYLGGRFFKQFDKNIGNYIYFKNTNHPNLYERHYDINIPPILWDRTTCNYVVKKSACKKILSLLMEKIVHKWDAIDAFYNHLKYEDIKTFDFFPHLFYSVLNNESDIQRNFEVIHF